MGCATIYPSGSVAAKPTIVHIPHSSTCIPERYRHEICLSYAELTAELLVMTDWFTDQLFGQASNYGATLFVNRISRLVMDPERFPGDQDEPMSAKGMGAIYTRTKDAEVKTYTYINITITGAITSTNTIPTNIHPIYLTNIRWKLPLSGINDDGLVHVRYYIKMGYVMNKLTPKEEMSCTFIAESVRMMILPI